MNLNISRNHVIVLFIIAIAGGAGIYFLMFHKTVQVGDTVFLDYVAYLDTGEVFDTTLEKVAMDDTQPKVWWFTLRATYEPMRTVIGQGLMPPDIEMMLIGMHEGEKKEISILPEKAFGLRDPDKVKEIPLIQTIDKEEEITVEEFMQKLRQEPVPDETYELQGSRIHVVEVTEEKVKLVYELERGQKITIALGNATVTGETETEYEITLDPSLGEYIATPFGQGIIIEIGENAMLVDFNYPLAGETLHYTIWVVRIEKAE
jgi:FKBP-type peptidyl-prolyl cis-trans isomerase 2